MKKKLDFRKWLAEHWNLKNAYIMEQRHTKKLIVMYKKNIIWGLKRIRKLVIKEDIAVQIRDDLYKHIDVDSKLYKTSGFIWYVRRYETDTDEEALIHSEGSIFRASKFLMGRLKDDPIIKFNRKLFYFLYEKRHLKRREKMRLLEHMFTFFLLRFTFVDYLEHRSKNLWFLYRTNRYFKKIKAYRYNYISTNWAFREWLKCYFFPIFKRRNFFLNFSSYSFTKYLTTGLVTEKGKFRSSKNYQVLLFKMFFSNYSKALCKSINLSFNLVSKRLGFIFFFLNFYLRKFNKKIYKFKYFKLETMTFPCYRTGYTTKMPRKPSRKKYILKKKHKYYF